MTDTEAVADAPGGVHRRDALARRVRGRLGAYGEVRQAREVREVTMFGGLSFMVDERRNGRQMGRGWITVPSGVSPRSGRA